MVLLRAGERCAGDIDSYKYKFQESMNFKSGQGFASRLLVSSDNNWIRGTNTPS